MASNPLRIKDMPMTTYFIYQGDIWMKSWNLAGDNVAVCTEDGLVHPFSDDVCADQLVDVCVVPKFMVKKGDELDEYVSDNTSSEQDKEG